MVYKVRISAPSEREADEISDMLIDKELVAGTLITSGRSRYHWQGDIEEKTYYNIQAYTVATLEDEIIEKVEQKHSDEAPIIELIEISGNDKFLNWVEESVRS